MTADADTEATLAGACELGMLEECWEHFFVRAKYDYLFVIDAPAVSSIHALPPHNVPHFGLSSLLPCPDAPRNVTGMSLDARQRHFTAEAEQFPLTLALTELLARYIFTPRWSGGLPKLISNHQVAALTRILDAVESHSIDEIKQATRNVNNADEMKKIRDLLMSVSSNESLVEEVEQHLQTLLPGVYGAYTTTRQLFRYLQVLPFGPDEDPPSTFLDTFAEIRAVLDEQNPALEPGMTLDGLVNNWSNAIPPSPTNTAFAHKFPHTKHTSESARSHSEHARTLAEIEYLNRGFARRGESFRLVFVTPTGRLFRANLKRFGEARTYNSRVVRHGSSDSFDKFMYQAALLAQPDGDMSMLPMLDPRVLMTSPDFVAYASRSTDAVSEYSSRSISAWIPVLLSPLRSPDSRVDIRRLRNLYEALKVGSSSATERAIREADLRSIDESAVKQAWDAYIRTVAAAESSERLIRRDALSELRATLLSGGDDVSLKAVILRRLDSTMSRWLSYVGGSVIQDLVARRQRADGGSLQVFVAAPPLIMPALSSDGASIEDLVSDLGRIQAADESTAWLTDPAYVHPSLSEHDSGRAYKTRYLQILGQCRLFAELEDWESSHTLADQAFSLAENVLRDETDHSAATYISGREAAFYGSFTLRRVPSYRASVDQHLADGKVWVARLASAVSAETSLVDRTSIRFDLHQARAQHEGLAWGLLRCIYQLQDRETGTQLGSGFISLELMRLADEYDALIELLQKAVLPKLVPDVFPDKKSFASYERATAYLLRESILDRIELEVLLRRQSGSANRDRLTSLVDLLSAENSWLPRYDTHRASASMRERALRRAAMRISQPTSSAEAWDADSKLLFDGPDAWRLRVILDV